MSDECKNCSEQDSDLKHWETFQYRYVCPHCLRTFRDNKYSEELFCWKCGQGLIVIPKKENL